MLSQNKQKEESFGDQDLVWGRNTNGVWWPGQITIGGKTSKKSMFRVDFFGYPQSYAHLPLSKIIKYDDDQGKLHPGRLSPELKRAINEARILFKTLQQSKNLVSNAQEAKMVSFVNLPEEKTQLMEPQKKQLQSNLQPIQTTKKIKKPTKTKQITETTITCQKFRNKIISADMRNSLNQDEKIWKILQPYHLHDIPIPEACEEICEEKKLTIRKLYNLLKRNNGKVKSRKLAIEFAANIRNTYQWRNVFKQCCHRGAGSRKKCRLLKELSK